MLLLVLHPAALVATGASTEVLDADESVTEVLHVHGGLHVHQEGSEDREWLVSGFG